MNKFKKLIFEEIPFNEQPGVLGGADPGGCTCSDYCSCYTTNTKDGNISKATDTAELVEPIG